MTAFQREPIFWSTANPDYNKPDRERQVMGSDGELRTERFPATGHIGDYENKITAPGQRFIKVCRHDGHVISLVLTNAAAHLDTNTAFATYQRLKCAALGWFPAAGCVAKLVVGGELNPQHLTVPLVDETPCAHGTHSLDKPCPHTEREIEARRARNKALDAKKMASFKTEANALLEEQRKGNEEQRKTNATLAALLEQQLANTGDGKRRTSKGGE